MSGFVGFFENARMHTGPQKTLLLVKWLYEEIFFFNFMKNVITFLYPLVK